MRGVYGWMAAVAVSCMRQNKRGIDETAGRKSNADVMVLTLTGSATRRR